MFKKSLHKKRATEAARGTRLGIRERNPLVMTPNVGRDRGVMD